MLYIIAAQWSKIIYDDEEKTPKVNNNDHNININNNKRMINNEDRASEVEVLPIVTATTPGHQATDSDSEFLIN